MANLLDRVLSSSVDVFTIAHEIAPEGKITGKQWQAKCPFHKEKTPSFFVDLQKGLCKCFGCGYRGDIINAYARLNNLSINQAAEELIRKFGHASASKDENIITQPTAATTTNPASQLKKAQSIWEKSLQDNPMLRSYFNSRGLEFKKYNNIRFYIGTTRELLQNGKDIPVKAMIAKVTDATGKMVSLHITELKEKDGKKVVRGDKRFFSGLPVKGSFVALGEFKNPTVAICEGIETGLSIKQALPTLTVLCALSASLMPNVVLHSAVKTVYIFIDNDEAGRTAGEKLYKRLEQNGIDTYIVAPKEKNADFNDVLQTEGVAGIIQAFGNAQKLEVKEHEQLQKKFTVMGKFTPRHITNELLGRYKIFVDKNEILWFYDRTSGLWVRDADAIAKSVLAKDILSDELNKIYVLREIIADLKRYAYRNELFPQSPLNLIPFNNGVYDINEDTLIPYEAEQYLTFKLPVNYNPAAQCNKINKFFSSIVDEPQELYELVAYTLWRDYPYQRFFILYGSGGNGKSTFLNILVKMLGEYNVSSTTLDALINTRFATATLAGKLANISGDEKLKKISNSAILKSLVGGDLITAERKGKEPFQFRNYAKLIISTNRIPATDDETPAFYRRVHLIKFSKKFEGLNEDKNIIQKLIISEEIEGLANKAIETLKHLIEHNFKFTNEAKTDEIAEKYELLSNPLKTFLDTFTQHTNYISEYIPNSELLNVYNEFLKQNNITPISAQQLKKEMQRLGYKTKPITYNGKTKRCWISLAWIPDVAQKLFNNPESVLTKNPAEGELSPPF